MATQDKSQQETPTAGTPSKKGSKVVLMILALALFACAGGGAWYYLHPAETGPAQASAKPKPAIFMPLESFTVNLLPSEGQAHQFVQAGLTLKLDDRDTADLIKDHMPQVRDRVLMVLSSKRGPELLPNEGKHKLAAELSRAIRNVIAPASMAAPQAAKHSATPVAPAAAAQASDKSEPAEAPGEAKPPRQQPAIEVLFTAFIIQ
jgi:flagellar FliL protein